MKRIVILISGRGSNMRAIVEAQLAATVAAVISNNPEAEGLDFAREYGIETAVVNHRAFPDRSAFDAALAAKAEAYGPDLVVLAGFMRILTETFIERFSGRIMNIHPSLLPAFPGTDTHRRALAEGVKLHGATVHLVTPELDHGPIVAQAAVPVLPGDSEQTLAARVLEQEHRIYPQAVRWYLEDKLQVIGNRVSLVGDCRFPDAIRSPEAA